jgi:hypothetical protein
MELIELVATVIAVVLVYGMAYMRARWQIDVAAQVKEVLESSCVDAVDMVEELGHQAKVKGKPLAPQDKENRALEIAKDLAVESAKRVGGKVLKEVTGAVAGMSGLGVLKRGILAVLGGSR